MIAEVSLIHITPNEAVEVAASLPYNSKQSEKLVSNVMASGHMSILRHASASFLIKNVSQSLLRQISRHPHINLTVKSSRYCNMSGAPYYIPNAPLKPDSISVLEDVDEFNTDMGTIMDIYKKWKGYEAGVKEFDVAKLFLPLASTTDLVLSGNFQALMEFTMLRNCIRAEKEIRNVSWQMTQILKQNSYIFEKAGFRFDITGICPEGKLACPKGKK
jgi:thymidylate synthase (FAD)